MTAGRGPIDDPRMDITSIPFELVMFAGAALGLFFGTWSLLGLGDAYKQIGHEGLSLDVPYKTGDEPVDARALAD